MGIVENAKTLKLELENCTTELETCKTKMFNKSYTICFVSVFGF